MVILRTPHLTNYLRSPQIKRGSTTEMRFQTQSRPDHSGRKTPGKGRF